jgi:hypothetical protein
MILSLLLCIQACIQQSIAIMVVLVLQINCHSDIKFDSSYEQLPAGFGKGMLNIHLCSQMNVCCKFELVTDCTQLQENKF